MFDIYRSSLYFLIINISNLVLNKKKNVKENCNNNKKNKKK